MIAEQRVFSSEEAVVSWVLSWCGLPQISLVSPAISISPPKVIDSERVAAIVARIESREKNTDQKVRRASESIGPLRRKARSMNRSYLKNPVSLSIHALKASLMPFSTARARVKPPGLV